MATEPIQQPIDSVDDLPQPPFLRRLRIRGYKSIAYCDVRLEPLTILVGRNASGKSNFLDALAFVRDAMELNIPEATKRHGGWHSILSRFSLEKDVEIVLEASLRPSGDVGAATSSALPVAEYGFVLREGPSEAPVLAREWFRTLVTEGGNGHPHFDLTSKGEPGGADASYEWEFRHPRVACSQVPTPRPDRLWLSSFGDRPFLDLADGLRCSAFYNFHPDAIRRLQKPSPASFLERDGGNLASVIEGTRKNEKAAFDRIGRYLSVVTDSVELLGEAKYGEYETVRFRVAGDARGQSLDFDAAGMSDGTLRALATLVAAFQSIVSRGQPKLVGIEEPETSLHPAAIRALVDALDEATGQTQIILTTHSADMLDDPTILPRNVRVVELIEGQTKIAPVDEASIEIVKKELDTLGGLERQNLLQADRDNLDGQQYVGHNGQGLKK